jgi:hypothetical protein
MGAMYAFVRVNREKLPNFDDQKFALELLERKHVLVAPGTSFNVPYADHFRLTLLPDWETVREVFARIESLLQEHFVEAHSEASPKNSAFGSLTQDGDKSAGVAGLGDGEEPRVPAEESPAEGREQHADPVPEGD